MSEEYKHAQLQVYHTYVAAISQFEARRTILNQTFFIFFVGLLGFAPKENNLTWAIVFVGLTIIWMASIFSMKTISSAKYIVLLSLENALQITPFTDEWNIVKKSRYIGLSNLEILQPIVMISAAMAHFFYF